MTPLVYVRPHGFVFWAVFGWAFWPEFGIVRRARAAAREPDSQDAGSTRVITVAMWFASLGAFVVAGWQGAQLPAAARLPAFAAGLALLVGGSLLRRHCWRQLGASFTGDVRARADQRVVDTGAYALLRHPSYTAGLLMNAGVGLALGSWASLALMVVGSALAYGYRIRVEERVLLATIGEPYRAFIATRKRLIPFVY